MGAAGAITPADVALGHGADGRPRAETGVVESDESRVLTNGIENYGCGLAVGTRDGLTVFTHGGAVSGFIAKIVRPQTKSAVVVVINNEDGPLANAAR